MTESATQTILALNGGSSSIKFALFGAGAERRLHGSIERVGTAGATLTSFAPGQAQAVSERVPAADFAAAIGFLIEWLEARQIFKSVIAVGHRVVHGMQRSEPERVSATVLAQLRKLVPYDPEHLPAEIQLMERMLARFPGLPQIACFDTAFHRTMPRVATQLPIPRRFESQGVRRYGFHGLSYAYLMQRLGELGDPAANCGRVILAHLGSGASLAAVQQGRSVDTTMGFTPASGIPMSTRSGDIDPGLLGFLAEQEHLTAAQLLRLLNHESGLLGISGTSADIRDLLEREAADPRAAEAISLFCQEVRKRIGAFSAVLGGLDTLVFSAGIGANSPVIRQRVCANLEFLGVRIDPALNARNAPVISAADSRVSVRVMPTDEESMIAQLAANLMRGC